MFFNSSQDLLYIVIAFSILWLTIFLSWILYYVAMILRGAYLLFGDIKHRIEQIDHFVSLVTSKLEATNSTLQLLVEGFGKIAGFLEERKTKKKSAKRTKREKSE